MEIGSQTPVLTPPAAAAGDVARLAVGNGNKADVGQVVPAVDRNAAKQKATNNGNNDSAADKAQQQKRGSELFKEAQIERKNNRDKRGEERDLQDQTIAIRQLKSRDRKVRAHERAHATASGGLGGAPSYSYTRGPDGVSYATSGSVQIDSAKVAGDPEATLRKAQQVKRAALAPADPSSQDRAVAAKASQQAIEARAEILVLQQRQRLAEAQQTESQTAQKETSEVATTQIEQQKKADQTEQERASERRKEIQDQLQANQRELQEKLNKAFQIEQAFKAGSLLRVTI